MSNSTNEIMFDCQEDLFYGEEAWMDNVAEFVTDYYETNGDERLTNQNFSHDNWTLVYLWTLKFLPEFTISLPLLEAHSRHPIRFMFYFFIRFPLLGWIFLPLIYIHILIMASIKTRIDNHGNVEIPTSEKLQGYFYLCAIKAKGGLGANLIFKLQTSLVNQSVGGWDRVFKIYYGVKHRVFSAYNKNISKTGNKLELL